MQIFREALPDVPPVCICFLEEEHGLPFLGVQAVPAVRIQRLHLQCQTYKKEKSAKCKNTKKLTYWQNEKDT